MGVFVFPLGLEDLDFALEIGAELALAFLVLDEEDKEEEEVEEEALDDDRAFTKITSFA